MLNLRSAWSPHGAVVLALLAAAAAGCRIEEFGPGGPDRSQGAQFRDPAWSPDGERIAFEGSFIDGADYIGGIFIAAATGGEAEWVAVGRSPDWSPDGTKLAYAWGSIRILDLATREETEIPGTNPAFNTAWSPDGRAIAYSFNIGTDSSGVWIVRLGSTPEVSRLPVGELRGTDPCWSPDGTRIAFGAFDPEYPADQLWVFDLRSSGLRRVTRHADYEFLRRPAWSPSGRFLSYSSGGALHVIDVESALERTLQETRYSDGSDWSPDGKHIVYVREHLVEPEQSLWVIGNDGNAPLHITAPE